jgi:hypothetical protein
VFATQNLHSFDPFDDASKGGVVTCFLLALGIISVYEFNREMAGRPLLLSKDCYIMIKSN